MRSYLAFIVALAVGLCFLSAVAHTALATGHGQQAVIVQEYVAAPQAVIVPYVQQQQAACVVEQFNAYSVPIQRQQFVQKQFVQQNFKQQQFRQRSRSSSGRQRSLSIQSSSSGGGFLRNILPF